MTGPSAAEPTGRLVIRRAPGAGSRPERPFDLGAPTTVGAADVPGGWRDALPLLLWFGALVAALGAFAALGRTPLASPPVTDPAGWWAWAQGRTADELAFNLLRILGVALTWYLLGATTIGALARLARVGGLVSVADRLTAPPVRRLLEAALGATLATSAVAAIPGAAIAPAPATVVVEGAEDAAAGEVVRVQPVVPGAIGAEGDLLHAESSLVVGRPVGHDGWTHLLGGPDRPAVGADAGVRTADVGEDASSRPANPSTEATSDRTWVVAPGDHFWSIAEREVQAAGSIGEDDVMAHWERLVEANRDRLVDPANPDLLLPGQVLVLPAWSS